MEYATTTALNSCENGTALIEPMKETASQIELESESKEQYFLMEQSEHHEHQSHQQDSKAANTEVICSVEDTEERPVWLNMCRICANINDHLIPIFYGEGVEHALCNKIHKYLPIHVTENDNLPLQLCFHCAATLLAWHELVEGCLEAEQRLMDMQTAPLEKQLYREMENKIGKPGKISQNIERLQAGTDNIVEIAAGDIQCTKTGEIQYLECDKCGENCIGTRELTDHLNRKHGDHVHYCSICKMVYHGSRADLEQHKLNHKNQEFGKDILRVIDNVFINKEKEGELEPDNARYICNLCEMTFAKKKELKNHINNHTDIRYNKELNEDEVNVIKKAKRIISDRIVYECETCRKHMYTKRGFLRHIRVHSNKRPCKCHFCGNCYRIKQDLVRHIKDVHQGLKNYLCDICGRAFANKGAKDDHRRIHTGERPYACVHCPKTFRTLNSIYIHNRIHTNYNPHKCSYCDKSFRNRQRLNNHVTTHTGVKAFPCEICGKRFSVKGEVIRHRAIHNKEKPFPCKKCGMTFGQKRYLRNHIKHHHKEQAILLLKELTKAHAFNDFTDC